MVEPPARRAVLFDLDDTLLPEWRYVRSGHRSVARSLHGASPKAQVLEDWLWRRFLEGRQRDSFDVLLTEGRLSGNATDVAELVQLYRQHIPEVELAPVVRAMLSDLRARGVGTGVISDGPLDSQKRKVAALGLETHCDLIILTDQWGRDFWKPHTRAFALAEQHFGLRGSQLCYVGDNLSKDFVAPTLLGWHRVLLRRDRQIHKRLPPPPTGRAELTARSWRALHAHLVNWLAQ